ncbi:programmed cell death protein 2-like [Drosophila rhopaloa]|uniref:Programmed cell death protein 2-like n=1 Tax=Drosophila rhopaloa TaxID=1041015 RepID=A0A6P4ER43_DRORH|nr:programmed cell death protein 2-like [Drosophila rhopaloa]
MAKNKSTVYLGYEDEEITPKQEQFLTSCTNKIGGTPDWPRHEVTVPTCPLCGAVRPLIVQMYAPLDRSQFHRSLYVFGCVSPACSQNSKSWTCVRTQHLDHQFEVISEQSPKAAATGKQHSKKKGKSSALQAVNWCSGADDWGDSGGGAIELAKTNSVALDEAMDITADDEQNERNGNVRPNALQYAKGDVQLGEPAKLEQVKIGGDEDDDEDESTSLENDLISGFHQMDMISAQNADDDPNANCAAAAAPSLDVAGASAASASICAEIEGPETDVVLVDTPKKPERDLIALLKHTSLSVSQIKDLTLKSYYIAVDVESKTQVEEYENYGGALSMDHIRDLYQEYKLRDEDAAHSPTGGACGSGDSGEDHESYEKALPAHGDIVFHNFITTIQQNPGQVLRYSRDALPLLVAPLTEPLPKCPNCKGETICEVQLLPTLIPKLRFQLNDCNAPIEYGNVLVFTCLKSCWDTPDLMRYEHIVVQSES